jgi:hypothetical protein
VPLFAGCSIVAVLIHKAIPAHAVTVKAAGIRISRFDCNAGKTLIASAIPSTQKKKPKVLRQSVRVAELVRRAVFRAALPHRKRPIAIGGAVAGRNSFAEGCGDLRSSGCGGRRPPHSADHRTALGWIPACAGMTKGLFFRRCDPSGVVIDAMTIRWYRPSASTTG